MKLAALALCLEAAGALTTLRVRDAGENPVTKVVKLLKEMKATAEAEAKEDEEIYSKMGCWCETNDAEKTEAIKVAEARIQSLSSTIETGTARAGELKTQIAGLEDDLAADKDARDQAAAIRATEKADFEAQDADLSESSGLLKEAIEVLSKVQLVQKKPTATLRQVEAANADALVQVRDIIQRAGKPKKAGAYFAVMQKDLWDFMGSMPGGNTAPRVITGLSQEDAPTGAAAGSKSYNSRSGGILGLLQTMKEQMDRDLAAAHKAEITAAIGFEKLRATKEGEIQAGAKSIEEKSTELADTNDKVAQAKEDLEDTKNALSSDEKFLMDLKERCKVAASNYATRSATRQDEITAIGETINILMEDDARDLINKQINFVQIRSTRQHQSGAAVSGELSTRQHAASQLLTVAKRHGGTSGGWNLALLAVSTQLDGFTKVKAMMDKMVAELKKQQQEEYEKHESCKKDIDTNEDHTMEKEAEKKDQEAKLEMLTGKLESLTQELSDLVTQVKEAHIALKQAGETRKKENHEFQQVVSDQRATIEILNKALARLQEFYNESFLQKQEPGAAVAPPPAAGKEYKKNGMSGGVMQLLAKIIQDAKAADQEAVAAEQESQQAYSEFVANSNEMLDSYEKAIASKTEAKDKANADKLTTNQDVASTKTALGDLNDQNKALHLSCDYLIKNYNIRQTARQEETEAIQEAKSILSGADFGF